VCGLFVLAARSCKSQKPTSAFGQQHTIGNLSWGDTLVLTAQSAAFAECGEWGAHREQIRIYLPAKQRPRAGANLLKWRQNLYIATWWVDPINCANQPGHRYILAAQRRMSAADELQVKQYLEQMLVCSLRAQEIVVAGESFQAVLLNQFQLSCHGHNLHQHDFGSLRHRLFTR
jgi:anthranilate/para-aminobenzoate synthase component I